MVAAEGFRDGMDVEVIDECQVSIGFFCCRRHDVLDFESWYNKKLKCAIRALFDLCSLCFSKQP